MEINKKKILIQILALFKPIIFIILFGEVGIKLYLQNFDKVFWLFLILGYVLIYFISLDYYKNMYNYNKDKNDKEQD